MYTVPSTSQESAPRETQPKIFKEIINWIAVTLRGPRLRRGGHFQDIFSQMLGGQSRSSAVLILLRLGGVTDTGHPLQVSLLCRFHVRHSHVFVPQRHGLELTVCVNPQSKSVIPFFLYAHAFKACETPFINSVSIYYVC